MDQIVLIGITIFIISYISIIADKPEKTLGALLGAGLMIFLHVISQHEAFEYVDLNVILLLAGMMVIVEIGAKTGVLEWAAIKLAIISKGEPIRVLIYMTLITALFSSVLDNVTTVILIAPITFIVAQQLEINPLPFLILEAIASSIGGTATLIGDPPNILIGSSAKLGFNDFLFNLSPVIVVILITFLITIYFVFRKEWHVPMDIKARVMDMDPSKLIKDKKSLIITVTVFFFTLLGFIAHQSMHLEPATVAILGATILMITTKTDPMEILKKIEWPALFFFGGLFILVGGFEKIGAIKYIAVKVISLTNGDLKTTSILLLWISAIISSIIGCIPYVVTIIPMVKQMIIDISAQMNIDSSVTASALWWSLSLGSCLGGCATLIGAAANLVVAGIAQRNGMKISSWQFFKYGFPLTIEAMLISTVYVYLRYLGGMQDIFDLFH